MTSWRKSSENQSVISKWDQSATAVLGGAFRTSWQPGQDSNLG